MTGDRNFFVGQLFNRQADLFVRERTCGGKLGNELFKHGTILSQARPAQIESARG